ncbi:hypothetical protein EVAR_80903_1 [Eumeta japonica]|uniref:Uncharacterized protein n=1 Tax=Eumeta variegata TaxID=151549 RepID=A0A4C1V1F7_EUMVA|nr:hypothetical protein EVAR_80903_1 [Eumeta japonica]
MEAAGRRRRPTTLSEADRGRAAGVSVRPARAHRQHVPRAPRTRNSAMYIEPTAFRVPSAESLAASEAAAGAAPPVWTQCLPSPLFAGKKAPLKTFDEISPLLQQGRKRDLKILIRENSWPINSPVRASLWPALCRQHQHGKSMLDGFYWDMVTQRDSATADNDMVSREHRCRVVLFSFGAPPRWRAPSSIGSVTAHVDRPLSWRPFVGMSRARSDRVARVLAKWIYKVLKLRLQSDFGDALCSWQRVNSPPAHLRRRLMIVRPRAAPGARRPPPDAGPLRNSTSDERSGVTCSAGGGVDVVDCTSVKLHVQPSPLGSTGDRCFSDGCRSGRYRFLNLWRSSGAAAPQIAEGLEIAPPPFVSAVMNII